MEVRVNSSVVFFKGHRVPVLELYAKNFYELIIHKKGERSYRFAREGTYQQITPIAFKGREILQQEFDRLFKAREKDVKITDKRPGNKN